LYTAPKSKQSLGAVTTGWSKNPPILLQYRCHDDEAIT